MPLWTEGETPEPVTEENPLAGLELDVLRIWKENSRKIRALHRSPGGRADVEAAVRAAVREAHVEEMRLRAQGMAMHEAQEFTRPSMWTPPM